MNKTSFLLGLISGLAVGYYAFAADTGTALIRDKGPKVVKLLNPETLRSGGTGFALRAPSGRTYTVTNAHVCDLAVGGYMAAARDESGRTVKLRVVEKMLTHDLCLLDGMPNVTGLEMGDYLDSTAPVYVLGHPLLGGLTLSFGYPTRRGTISLSQEESPAECTKPGQTVREAPGMFGVIFAVCVRELEAQETSAVIYPGNSGSPLLNERGQVVGVMFAGDSRSNYGSAVPLEYLRGFVSIY